MTSLNNFMSAFEDLSNIYKENSEQAKLRSRERRSKLITESKLREKVEEVPVEEAPVEDTAVEIIPDQAVLECAKCGALVIKPIEELISADDSDLVNIEEECSFCEATEGYKVIGDFIPKAEQTAEASEEVEEENEEIIEDSEDEIEIEDDEVIEEGIFDKLKKNKAPKDFALIARSGTLAGIILYNKTEEEAEEALEKYKNKAGYGNLKVVKMDSPEYRQAKQKTDARYKEPVKPTPEPAAQKVQKSTAKKPFDDRASEPDNLVYQPETDRYVQSI